MSHSITKFLARRNLVVTPSLPLQFLKLLCCNMDIIGMIKEKFSCCFSKVNVRVIKLLISLWMIADVIFDGFTTKGYLDYALETRNASAYPATPGTGGPQKTVSFWCFVASMAVWFLTPLIFMPFGFWWGLAGFRFTKINEGVEEDQETSISCGKILCSYISAVFWVYLYIPCKDIYLCFSSLLCHDSYKDNEEDESNGLPHALLPTLKLFEQFGEAIPQFAIAVIFYSKNFEWLDMGERAVGVATMTLSCGSILIGVTNGCPKQGRVRRFYFGETGFKERGDGVTMAYGRRI